MVSLRNVRIVNCGTAISVPKGQLARLEVDGLEIEFCKVGLEERDEPVSTRLKVNTFEIDVPGVWDVGDVSEFVSAIGANKGRADAVGASTTIGRAWVAISSGTAFTDAVLSIYGAIAGS